MCGPIDNYLLGVGVVTGLGAAGAIALSNPIGAAGGALYAVCGVVISSVIEIFATKVCCAEENETQCISRVIAFAISFFAGSAAAWAIANAVGFTLTFGGALALSGFAFGIPIAVLIISNVLSRCFETA